MKDQTVEKELKYELDQKGASKLRRLLKNRPQKRVYQRNVYFDTPSLKFRKERIGLRIRFLDKKEAELTVKATVFNTQGKAKSNGIKNYKERKEFNAPLKISEAKKCIQKTEKLFALELKPIRQIQKRFPESVLEKVVPLGALCNHRTIVDWNQDLCLELDRYELNGQTYYELECETSRPKKADKMIREFLEDHKIEYEPSQTSKLARFLKDHKKRRPSKNRRASR